jgi:hypothetical protein
MRRETLGSIGFTLRKVPEGDEAGRVGDRGDGFGSEKRRREEKKREELHS